MNNLSKKAIAISILLTIITAGVSFAIARVIYEVWPFSDFKAILSVAICFIAFYTIGFVVFGTYFRMGDSLLGEVTPQSKNKVYVDVYVLFLLVYFDPIFLNPFLPAFIHNLFYAILGCKMGKNSYTAGVILDPQLVKIGDETILGAQSMVIPHLFYGGRTSFLQIEIGSHVTIGARAIIFGGTKIEDGCILASGAVLSKNSHMKKNEIWGGVPAKFIKMRDDSPDSN